MQERDVLAEKIAGAIEKVKSLKHERDMLKQKVAELEQLLVQKDQVIKGLQTERTALRAQLEELLQELESIQI